MKLTWVLCVSAQLLAASSLSIPTTSRSVKTVRRQHALISRVTNSTGTPAEGAAGAPKKEPAEDAAEGEEKENEKEIEGQFNVAIRLEGAGLKQDVLFPPGTNGRLEVEFQNPVGRTLTVTENRTPAAPPPGFTALEAVSYKVSLAEGAQGMTLSKIDYILNAGNALDISKGQVGRLFSEANIFVIDPALGELEFEAEENELTLKVANINGEFAIFVPQEAGGGAAARV